MIGIPPWSIPSRLGCVAIQPRRKRYSKISSCRYGWRRNGLLRNALLQQAKATASAEMANKLAHRINNPLQSLMNVAYLAAEGESDYDTKTLGQDLSAELRLLSALVTESLALPTEDRS